MKTFRYGLLTLLFLAFVAGGCKKDEPAEEEPVQASALTQRINNFILESMTDVYLWYASMPEIDVRYETDSKEYFYKLLFKDDKWSYVTDDITAFENSLEGKEKTFGYSLTFGRFVDASGAPTGNYFGIVEYVYPNTPASRAGFVRGDLIIKLNSDNITQSNYKGLLSGTSITVTKGVLGSTGIATGLTLSLTAEDLTLDPVMMYKVIERDGHKIGYLLYMQYISSYNSTSLLAALQYFKNNQITDLVLDLRYNPGGYTSAAQYLCSSIAPQTVVNNKSTLVSYQWNDKYQSYFTKNNVQDQLGVKFDSSVPVKLDLSKVTVLTTNGSASASELTICGLEPYMDVTLIGDTTYGKYTASITLKPEDIFSKPSDYEDFKNWGIQPIVIRYANSQGVTSFTKGFAPDFLVADAMLPAYPLGELTEPLLKKAVENITGKAVTGMKKAEIPFKYEIIDRGFSKFDRLKKNLYIDKPFDRQEIRGE